MKVESIYKLTIEGKKIRVSIPNTNRIILISAFGSGGSRVDLTPSQYLVALAHTFVSELFRMSHLPRGEYPEVYFQSVYQMIEIAERVSGLEAKADSSSFPED